MREVIVRFLRTKYSKIFRPVELKLKDMQSLRFSIISMNKLPNGRKRFPSGIFFVKTKLCTCTPSFLFNTIDVLSQLYPQLQYFLNRLLPPNNSTFHINKPPSPKHNVHSTSPQSMYDSRQSIPNKAVHNIQLTSRSPN